MPPCSSTATNLQVVEPASTPIAAGHFGMIALLGVPATLIASPIVAAIVTTAAVALPISMASPGVVLFSSMIERQIERGVPVFDFLKGDEAYKYRHGAAPRPLFAIEGVIA